MTQCPLSCALFPPVPLEINALPQVWSKASMPFYRRAYFRLFFWRVWGDKVSCVVFGSGLSSGETSLKNLGHGRPSLSGSALAMAPLSRDLETLNLRILNRHFDGYRPFIWYCWNHPEFSSMRHLYALKWCLCSGVDNTEDLGFVSFVCEPLMFWFCSWSSYGFLRPRLGYLPKVSSSLFHLQGVVL